MYPAVNGVVSCVRRPSVVIRVDLLCRSFGIADSFLYPAEDEMINPHAGVHRSGILKPEAGFFRQKKREIYTLN